jgi:hypothetical protein
MSDPMIKVSYPPGYVRKWWPLKPWVNGLLAFGIVLLFAAIHSC